MSDITDIKGDFVQGDKIGGDKVGGDKITNVVLPPSSQQTARDRANTRNRKNYLNVLQTTWIDGFLHQSLHDEVIKLTMTHADDGLLARAIHQPSWRMVKRQAGQADEPIPLDKPAATIFDESGRGLLILGDPGSGKTITLLQLAEQLLNEATKSESLMPVVLNLSSWGQTRLPLIEWLVEEIFVQYSVGRALARTWIEENRFIYLLDGLDEVAADGREACIEAINRFRADRAGVVEMAVCSRTADYEQLTARLNLTAAIQIQPLTDAQVDSYLRQPKLELQAVRGMLKTDPALTELTRTPLMLNVMTLAYRGKTRADLQQFSTTQARRTHLFDTYIDAMFTRRPLPANSGYTETDARHWLTEVAYGLTSHGLSELYLEKLQHTWLLNGKHCYLYAILCGLPFGLFAGFLFGIIFGILFSPVVGIIFGLSIGLSGGLSVGLHKAENKIELVETYWMLPPFREIFKAVTYRLVILLITLLMIVLIDIFIDGLLREIFDGWGGLLFFVLTFGLISGLNDGLGVCFVKRETWKKVMPNQGIRDSLYNAWRIGLILSIMFGVTTGLMYIFLNWISLGMVKPALGGTGVVTAMLVGILSAYRRYGGAMVTNHYRLRWVLARQGVLPYPLRDKKLIAYLDAMVERLLLRRVGNGYMFIHRTLLEHFAAKHELANSGSLSQE